MALLLVDLPQLLARLHVVGEARDHRLELVGGLVDEPVLAEDLALGEVLLDELAVLVAERSGDLDGRARRAPGADAAAAGGAGAAAAARGAARRRRGRDGRGLVAAERSNSSSIELRHGGGGPRAARARPPAQLARTNSSFVLCCWFCGSRCTQDLEHGGRLAELALR